MENSICDWIINLNWSLILTNSSSISTIILSIFSIIGFFLVLKQIKIVKNKDIFFNFQKNLESELNFIAKKNFDFMNEYQSLLNDFILNAPITIDLHPQLYSKEVSDEYHAKRATKRKELVNHLYTKLWDIFKKYETIFYPKITTLDRWWLEENYNNLLNIKDSDEYLNQINFTRNVHEKYKKIYESDRNNIIELRQIIHFEYTLSCDNAKKLAKILSNFLVKLSKEKGIL